MIILNIMSSNNLNQEEAATVEKASPPIEEMSPPIEEMSPPIEEMSPPIEEMSPPIEEMSPPIEEMSPPIEEVSPLVEKVSPLVEDEFVAVEDEFVAVEDEFVAVEDKFVAVEEVGLINKNNIKNIEEIRENRLLRIKSNRNDDTSENDLNENSEDIGCIKRGQPIDYNKLYENLEKYCNLKRQTHWMCAKYYNSLDRLFLIPSICLSSFSGIASFLSSVESFESYQTGVSVGVGIMASCTTLLQSFSNAFGFSTKAEAHQNATESFDQIITKIRFQKVNPKDGVKDTDFITELENQIVETKQRCKYVVPEWVEEEYRDNKFNSLKGTLSRNVYKQLANIKTDKYLSAAKKKEYSKINLDDIDLELGLKDDEKKCCF